MSQTIKRLACELAVRQRIPVREARGFVRRFRDVLFGAVEAGDRVEIRGFGVLSSRVREPGPVRCVRSNTVKLMPRRRVIRFRASRSIEQRLNGPIEAIVQAVRRDIDEDIGETADQQHPAAEDVERALEIAWALAARFVDSDCVDIAGFVETDGRVAVLAHQRETGRRVTFYVRGDDVKALSTSVTGSPVWSDVQNDEQFGELCDWLSRV